MTYHTLALGTLVYEKHSHHNTYPKIQESYETAYTYPTLKIQNFCNINTSMFYISKKFLKPGLPYMHFTTYPCNAGSNPWFCPSLRDFKDNSTSEHYWEYLCVRLRNQQTCFSYNHN